MHLSRRRFANTLVCLALCGLALPISLAAQPRLPERLTNAEFWTMVTGTSEAGGYFQSDNFTSNEMPYPNVISTMRALGDTGGAYLGVGPEQNFHYVTGIRPRIAFIVDIRRQAVMHHLMYKAVFELSRDRADFISLLFSKPRPAGLDTNTTIGDIWEAYWFVPTDTVVYPRNLARIKDHLTRTRGFALDSNDIASLTYVYEAFYRLGPMINYGGYGGGANLILRNPTSMTVTLRGTVAGTAATAGSVAGFPVGSIVAAPNSTGSITSYYGGTNFAALSVSADQNGVPRSFLATEENFRYMKGMHDKNLFIPIVGDFAGPKAIRGVAQYLRDHGATLTAFYTSNVETYLFQNNVWRQFYENAATLPVTPRSVFIRSGNRTCPIAAFLASASAGRVRVYNDAYNCVP